MITVSWGTNEESGFASRDAAKLFIDRICMKVNPKLDYSIKEITQYPVGKK